MYVLHVETEPWDERPVPAALSPEKLASLVESSLRGADALLFTATPREELDEIGRFQQLKDQAWVGMVRAIVAAYNRAPAAQREFSCDEVALAVGAGFGTASRLVVEALAVSALPGLVEAVAAGTLTERHALAVLRELDTVELTLEQRQCVVLIALARFAGQTPGELMKVIRRLILTVDRAAAQARRDKATSQRRVDFYPDADGQGVLHACGPLEAIAAMKAALEASLGSREAGDERSKGEREFDLLVDLLTGTTEAAGWHAHVVIPYRTATGGNVELAEVPGFGPILPSTARDLLDDALDLTAVNVDENGIPFSVSDPVTPEPLAEHAPVSAARPAPAGLTDPIQDALRAMARNPAPAGCSNRGVAGYRVPARVQRFLEARDRTCVFPHCTRPAAATDKDHRNPWPQGATHPDNLQCLCRHHHRAKQAAFTVEKLPSGDYQWTSRGGWTFTRQPKGY
ncbi:MAG: putative endonuclease [Frankiales bacterium]|nr:putative endonuclease [Frankiales bacterium]